MSELGHVWTAPWQELSDVFAALVGCGHVSGLLVRQVWPLALMLCADRVPNKKAHFRSRALTQAGSPDPRNDRICITSSCRSICRRASCRQQQQFRLLVFLAPDHDGPGHPCNLVGQRHGCHFRGAALHQPAKPRPPLGTVLARATMRSLLVYHHLRQIVSANSCRCEILIDRLW